ncbi:MAG: GDSL-type esterase/lipase family protein [Candidatus Thermoplasmatota archaeon]
MRVLLALLFVSGWFTSGLAASRSDRPIVAFGDSYTEGTTARRSEAFPALMEASLGIPVVNAGRLGETAHEALPRLERDVLRHNPRLVIVEFGVNEAFRGDTVAEAAAGLDAILTRLAGIPVVLVGVHYAAFQENFDAALRDLSARHGTGLVLDAIAGLLDDAATTRDGYHPNAAGYRILEARIRPEVERVLALADRQA